MNHYYISPEFRFVQNESLVKDDVDARLKKALLVHRGLVSVDGEGRVAVAPLAEEACLRGCGVLRPASVARSVPAVQLQHYANQLAHWLVRPALLALAFASHASPSPPGPAVAAPVATGPEQAEPALAAPAAGEADVIPEHICSISVPTTPSPDEALGPLEPVGPLGIAPRSVCLEELGRRFAFLRTLFAEDFIFERGHADADLRAALAAAAAAGELCLETTTGTRTAHLLLPRGSPDSLLATLLGFMRPFVVAYSAAAETLLGLAAMPTPLADLARLVQRNIEPRAAAEGAFSALSLDTIRHALRAFARQGLMLTHGSGVVGHTEKLLEALDHLGGPVATSAAASAATSAAAPAAASAAASAAALGAKSKL